MQKRKLKVFLSHSPDDEVPARQLYDQLNAEGWMDIWLAEENLLVGQDWRLEIEKAINTTESAVVCVSKSSTTQQGHYQKELRMILEMAQNMPDGTVYLIPFKLEECELPFLLRDLQFPQKFEKDREKSYQRLLMSLHARADGLDIASVRLAPGRSKTPIKNDAAEPAKPDQGATAPYTSISRNAQGNIVIMGDNNVIYPSGQPVIEPPAQPQVPD